MFLVEEPASWLVLRKLVGAPDQTDFGEEHVASFLVLFSFCRQNHILLNCSSSFVEFLLLKSLIQIIFVLLFPNCGPHHATEVPPSAEMGSAAASWAGHHFVASCCFLALGYPRKDCVAQMGYHTAVGLFLLDEASSSSQDPFNVSVGLLLSGHLCGFTADGFSWRIEKRLPDHQHCLPSRWAMD